MNDPMRVTSYPSMMTVVEITILVRAGMLAFLFFSFPLVLIWAYQSSYKREIARYVSYFGIFNVNIPFQFGN